MNSDTQPAPTSALPLFPDSTLAEKLAVLFLAMALGVGAILWAFFVDRHPEPDDLGLFNPPYMYFHHGSVTYPAHSQFNSMFVHPPIHYWVLGVLMKAGLPPYYAEAVPPLFFILLGLFLLCRSPFPYPVKVGLFLAFTVPFMYMRFEPRMRPETHIAFAWLAGLLLLEAGRLRGWNPARLFAESLLDGARMGGRFLRQQRLRPNGKDSDWLCSRHRARFACSTKP